MDTQKRFYVYEWFDSDTGYVFYVGKGCRNRARNTRGRNKLFCEYLKNHNCDNRIVKFFDKEKDAFCFENSRIVELKGLGQAHCNLDNGGVGGVNFVWTPEMRAYKSKFNHMKSAEQRQRMSVNNPMKNKNVKTRVAQKLSKAVILNGVFYKSVTQASKKTGHGEWTIIKWCRNGYDVWGNPCRYSCEKQKEIPAIKKLHPLAATPKAVIVDGIYYYTISDAAEAIGGWAENIIRAIKGNRKYKGHTCSYANQQPSRKNAK